MGYDLRIHLVKASSTLPRNYEYKDEVLELCYAEELAMVELCGVGEEIHQYIKTLPKSDHMIYDGDTPIIEDKYGSRLRIEKDPMYFNIVLEKAFVDSKRYSDNGPLGYRRYAMALAILESMMGRFDGLAILFYGH